MWQYDAGILLAGGNALAPAQDYHQRRHIEHQAGRRAYLTQQMTPEQIDASYRTDGRSTVTLMPPSQN